MSGRDITVIGASAGGIAIAALPGLEENERLASPIPVPPDDRD